MSASIWLPKGEPGDKGPDGDPGPQGPPGPQGLPGVGLDDLVTAGDPNKSVGAQPFDEDLAYPVGSAGAAIKLALAANTDRPYLDSRDYGIQSLEEGVNDPVGTAAKFELLRAAAETLKAIVIVRPGTYILPQEVRLNANNTDWYFSPGSLLKLSSVQATDDFILFWQPQNQKVTGLKIDASRESQNSALFGIDNCACMLVDGDACDFYDVEIISSPAKGFGVVSSAGGTNRNIFINNFRAKNCNNQALLVDGNNMTGFFDRIIIDGVLIGATSHAGVAINDGVHSLQLSNVIADVQNAAWDAVAVRDSWDIQLTNIRGKRGRNGIQVQRLNGFTGRVQLNNIVGEENNQNGIMLLGAENVTGSNVVGRNNTAAAINIAATSGGVRCKNVNLSTIQAFDDRTSKVQQWGLLIQGVDSCRIGKYQAYGNTTRNVSVVRASTSEVEIEVVREIEVPTGSIVAQSQAVVTALFSNALFDQTAMDDANYDVQMYIAEGTTGRALLPGHVVARVASQVQILVYNMHPSAAHEGTLYVRVSRKK